MRWIAQIGVFAAACGSHPVTKTDSRTVPHHTPTFEVDAAVTPTSMPDAMPAPAPADAWSPAAGSPIEGPALAVTAAPPPPKLPRAGAKGCYTSDDAFAAESAHGDYVGALTRRALAARGWTALSSARQNPGIPNAVLVARQAASCGPPDTYAIDSDSNVFAYSVEIDCAKLTKLKVCSTWGVGGCGTEPPPEDWYVTAPSNARVLAAKPKLVVKVPRCIEIVPTEGFTYPP